MNKPNVCPTSVGARFTEANNALKVCLEVLDSIASEPYIPSIRLTAFAHIVDKIENIQSNIHSLRMQLAHLELCAPGHRCREHCPGCGCQHEPGSNGPGCQVCMEIGAR